MAELIARYRAARLGVRRRGEDGMALLAVLMVTLVFGLMVVALLTMTMSSLMIGSKLSATAADERAANAALETWVNQLKTSVEPGGACGPVTIPGTGGTTLTVNVDCTSDDPPAPAGLAGNTAMLLLGNLGTDETLYRTNNATQAVNWLLPWFFPALSQWTKSILPGLLHYGKSPMEVETGDVRVATEGLFARVDQAGNPQNYDEPARPYALLVKHGRYQQGRTSRLGGSVNVFGMQSSSCGMLDPGFDTAFAPWWTPDNLKFLHVSATGGLSCASDPASTFADPGWAAPVPPTPWSAARLRTGMGLAGNCSSKQLPGVPVIALQPGQYNRYDTAVLSRWMSRQDCAGGFTFWFRPGDYYFDASGVTGGIDASRNALVINDPTSNVVFGTPTPQSDDYGIPNPGFWDPSVGKAPNVARTCDNRRTSPGVTITLSSRTTLLHLAGMVSACARWDKVDGIVALQQRPLIYSAPALPGGSWIGPPNAGQLPKTFTCPASNEYCTPPAFDLTGYSGAPIADLKTSWLRIRGYSSWTNPSGGTYVDWTVTANGKSCSDRSLIGAGWFNSDVNLLLKCSQFTDASDFDGAQVTMRPFVGRGAPCSWWLFFPIFCDSSVKFDTVTIDTTVEDLPPGPFETRVDPPDPATPGASGTMLNLYGPVYLPRTQIIVRWRSPDVKPRQLDPVFTGGLVAGAMASLPFDPDGSAGAWGEPGMLAGTAPVENSTMTLKATSGGRLLGVAEVRIGTAANRPVKVISWHTCDVPATEPACPASS